MPRKNAKPAREWADPDDAPVLTKEWFESADLHEGGQLISRGRGRPKLRHPKTSVHLRLSPAVVEVFKAEGPGWQTRINAVLERYVARKRSSADAAAGRKKA
jgi:uncharacterized protein (DUF4415 family)